MKLFEFIRNSKPPLMQITYLETLMRFLAWGDILSRVWYSYYRNVVVVAAQEMLSSWDDVAQNDCGPERI
jgi:hypothetical protein